MKKKLVLSLILFTVILMATCKTAKVQQSAEKKSPAEDRNKWIAEINNYLKGKEHAPVDSVFTNLKVLGGFEAQNLVFAMEVWSKALGVSCGHCHNTSNFALDEKHEKDIAREMVRIGNMISAKLKTIEGLSERPIVNCVTCHRGSLKPAYKMPEL